MKHSALWVSMRLTELRTQLDKCLKEGDIYKSARFLKHDIRMLERTLRRL